MAQSNNFRKLQFRQQVDKMNLPKKTVINTMAYLGAAISQGQLKSGVQLSPDQYRKAGLFEGLKKKFPLNKINDYGNISLQGVGKQQFKHFNQPNILNGDLLPPLLKSLSKKVETIAKEKQNDFLLTVGGDHSIGSATISGMLSRYPNLKVIWVDAHADMVDPTHAIRPQYSYHGMPLSHVSGVFNLNGFQWMNKLPFENIVLIGIRDIEEGEFQTIIKNKVKAFTMDHVDKYGIGNVMEQAIQYLDPKGDAPFHISFDVDGLDPDCFKQTGTLFRYGLSPREGCHIIRRVAHQRKLVSMDLVEINADISPDSLKRQKYREEEYYNDVSQSVGIGIDLIESVFRKYLIL